MTQPTDEELEDLGLIRMSLSEEDELFERLDRDEVRPTVYIYKEREPQPESYSRSFLNSYGFRQGPERLMTHESRRPPVRVGVTHKLPEPAPLTKRQKRRLKGKVK